MEVINNDQAADITAANTLEGAMAQTVNDIIAQAEAMPTQEEILKQEFLDKLMKVRVSVKDEFPQEECLLSVGGVEFFAKGDIHAIKAKQKQGKTNAISIMVAAILSGKWGPLKAVKEGAKVLVIDTEQKAADTQLVYNRTLELAGLPKEDIFDRFQTFTLRSYEREQKLEALKVLISEFKPDIVIVDGIVDLMGNFNEVDDSKNIIEELIRLSTKEVSGVDAAIVCVLHTNKATEDHNMRGHAGTMLAQKAGVVLEVTKKDGIFTISNSDSRHKEVPSWSYRFDRDGHIVDACAEREQMLEQMKATKVENQRQRNEKIREERIATMLDVIRGSHEAFTRSSLCKVLQTKFNLGQSTVWNFINECIGKVIALSNNSLVYIIAEANAIQQQLPLN